jgi:ribonuclease BN (tRNA processing enzyme)
VTTLLCTAGTGTAAPHPRRASAAHWVEHGGVRLLMDCGAGALHRLAGFGLPWQRLTHLALTHFHLDHVGEVPALVFALKYATVPQRDAPLAIAGPAGTRALLARLAEAHGAWLTEPGFPLAVHELGPEATLDLGAGVQLAAHPVPHTGESVALGVTTPDGRLVYTGDTGPSDDLAEWARGCDLLLAECSLPESMALAHHLTPHRAGALAARAGAKRLVLTHFYHPVEQVDIVAEVRRAFAGPVDLAEDGARYTLPRD